MTGIKLHDCFIVSVTRAEHVKAEANKIQFFNDNLHTAIKLFIKYAQDGR